VKRSAPEVAFANYGYANSRLSFCEPFFDDTNSDFAAGIAHQVSSDARQSRSTGIFAGGSCLPIFLIRGGDGDHCQANLAGATLHGTHLVNGELARGVHLPSSPKCFDGSAGARRSAGKLQGKRGDKANGHFSLRRSCLALPGDTLRR